MTRAASMAHPDPQTLHQESTSAFGTHSMTDYDESATARAQYLERSSRQLQLQQMQHQQLTTDENPLSNEPLIPVESHPVYSETHQSALTETSSRRAAHSSWNLPGFSSENPFQPPTRRSEPGMYSLGQDDINRNLVSSYQDLPLRGAGLLQAPPTYTDATRSKEYYEQQQHTLVPESTISASLRPPRGVRFREASFASPPRHISQSMLKLPSQSRIRQPPLLQGPYNPAPALSQTAETRSTLGHSVQTVHGGAISTSTCTLGSAYSTNIAPLYQHRSSPISQNIVNSRLSHQESLNEHFLSQHQPDMVTLCQIECT